MCVHALMNSHHCSRLTIPYAIFFIACAFIIRSSVVIFSDAGCSKVLDMQPNDTKMLIFHFSASKHVHEYGQKNSADPF